MFRSGEAQLTVLNDISFTLQRAELCAILGPSGSGKTTMMAIAAGLERPTSGQVLLCGVDLAHQTEDEIAILRREQVGFVFQSFHLIPTLTALENVMLPLELGGKRVEAEAKNLLATFGLEDRISHYPSQLSGGEQQRVTLARAFINKPKILFADEPTGNLDAENASRALEGMLRMNNELGTAILLVTHDGELARKMSRTIRLRSGAVMEER